MRIHDVAGFQEYLHALRERIPDKKVSHCVFVTEYLASFAPDLGIAAEQIVAAGMLHDLCRALDNTEMIRRAEGHGIPVSDTARKKPNLLHGALAAVEAKRLFDLDDTICDAIAFHTTGRADWTPLGVALYVADFAEPSRRHPEAKIARDILRREGFQEALLYVVRSKREMLQKKPVVDPTSATFFLWVEETFGE